MARAKLDVWQVSCLSYTQDNLGMKFHISFAHIVMMANSLLSSVMYVIRSARYIEPAVALRDHSRNWISARSPLMSLSVALGIVMFARNHTCK